MEWSQKATLRENPPLARLPIDRYDLWPVNLLRSANATGALQMKPDRAVSFLKGFAKIPDADVGRTTKLCEGIRRDNTLPCMTADQARASC